MILLKRLLCSDIKSYPGPVACMNLPCGTIGLMYTAKLRSVRAQEGPSRIPATEGLVQTYAVHERGSLERAVRGVGDERTRSWAPGTGAKRSRQRPGGAPTIVS